MPRHCLPAAVLRDTDFAGHEVRFGFDTRRSSTHKDAVVRNCNQLVDVPVASVPTTAADCRKSGKTESDRHSPSRSVGTGS